MAMVCGSESHALPCSVMTYGVRIEQAGMSSTRVSNSAFDIVLHLVKCATEIVTMCALSPE